MIKGYIYNIDICTQSFYDLNHIYSPISGRDIYWCYNSAVTTNKKSAKKRSKSKNPGSNTAFICFNRECKLRRQKTCRGFEGCPGFKGK
jgi:hypothetical protein